MAVRFFIQKKLIIHRKFAHKIIQRNMATFFKWFVCSHDVYDSGNLKIPVRFPQMAKCNKMPTERIKN